MIEDRVFTIKEAEGLIPELSDLIIKLQEKRSGIAKKEVEIDALELITDPDSEESFSHLNREMEGLNQVISVFNEIVEKVHRYGCFLKDVDAGLIDFYSVIGGNVVYLCWKLGEKKIAYWHELGKGYTSRQPIPKDLC